MSVPSTYVSVTQCGSSVRVSTRRFALPSRMPPTPRDPASLSSEERQLKDAYNVYRSILRASNNFVAYAATNEEVLRYWVTLSFNPVESAKGIDLAKEVRKWFTGRFKRLAIHTAYLVVFVPNEKGVWHCHMLLGEIPKGEFVKPSAAPECASKDTLAMEAAGCDVFVWPSFYDRFRSLSHIVPFGSYDLTHCQVQVYGKAVYCARQYLPACDKGTGFSKEDYIALMEFYRDHVPMNKRVYFHSRNLAKPAKLYSGFIPTEIAEETWRDVVGKAMGKFGSTTTSDIHSAMFDAFRAILEGYGEFKDPV